MKALLSERTDSDVDRLVELRLRRQEALTQRTPPLQLEVVLDESVLVVGSQDPADGGGTHPRLAG